MVNKKKSDGGLIILLSAVIIIAITLLIANILRQDTSTSDTGSSELGLACESAGGVWLAEYNECEAVSENTCNNLGGTFYECESACRHDTKATACITMCMPVCKF